MNTIKQGAEQNPSLNTTRPETVSTQPPQISQNHQSVVRPLTPQITTKTQTPKGSSMKKPKPILIGALVVVLGIVSGYVLAASRNNTGPGGLKQEAGLKREVTSSEITVGTKVGVADEKTFKDSAEGALEKGGIDGEGSHHIKRPGGDSQTVYITSSVIDLDQFIGRKVKVWGETMAAEKAGWFMDVGKLEVLE